MHPELNFICLTYENLEFLIPKTDVFTAVSCMEQDFFSDENGLPKIRIATQDLDYIDFDNCAKSFSQSIPEKNIKTCVVVNYDKNKTQENRIGILTSSDCKVKQIDLKQFSLFSDYYCNQLKNKGIIACTFSSEKNKISYLLETEVFLNNFEESLK